MMTSVADLHRGGGGNHLRQHIIEASHDKINLF